MSKYTVGLTGGIGSGKTTIMKMFEALGVECIDADVVAREVVEPGTQAIAQIEAHFGSEFILPDGSLNRVLLRKKVFEDSDAKSWLNNLLHPLIREQMIAQLSTAKSQYSILVAPLLLENHLTSMVNRVLVVDIPESEQIIRSCKRDNNSEEQIRNIIASQIDRESRLNKADDIIDNHQQSMAQVQLQVAELHQTYLEFAEKSTL